MWHFAAKRNILGLAEKVRQYIYSLSYDDLQWRNEGTQSYIEILKVTECQTAPLHIVIFPKFYQLDNTNPRPVRRQLSMVMMVGWYLKSYIREFKMNRMEIKGISISLFWILVMDGIEQKQREMEMALKRLVCSQNLWSVVRADLMLQFNSKRGKSAALATSRHKNRKMCYIER